MHTCTRQSSKMTFCKILMKESTISRTRCFLKGVTNVYLYRLLSFFNHRRQNQEFLIFTSKFEILLMRLKAARMDLMPVFTAQSPSFRQSVQDANARTIARHQQAAGARAPPPALLNENDPTVLRQYIQGMQDRQRDAFPFGDNLIAQFFIIQSVTNPMSLRNISLENYSYEMLKTHYHELFITTRTSIQDPSIRSNTFFIIEQGEYEGEESFWVEDEEGLEGFMSNNDEETFWVLKENDAFITRKDLDVGFSLVPLDQELWNCNPVVVSICFH